MKAVLAARGAIVAILTTFLCIACSKPEPTTTPPASATTPASTPTAPQPDRALPTGPDPEVLVTVDQVLSSETHSGLKWAKIPDIVPELRSVYDLEPDRLFWFEGTQPVPRLQAAVDALEAVGEHGLDPADYDADTLRQQWTSISRGESSAADQALFDMAVTAAAARALKAVFMGRVDPATLYWRYDNSAKQADIASWLREARDGEGLRAKLDAVAPQVSHYDRARRTLAIYKERALAGEPESLEPLAKGRKVEPGEMWAGIPQLAARLRVFGDLAADVSIEESTYTPALVEAVKRFQQRHGLTIDGVVGAGTIKALNVSLADRVRQIELAMERMRWLPPLTDRPNVFVNVALFRMWATDPATGEEPLRMNVVVGQSLDHQTPIFIEQMEYVIFRPYWNPPRGITLKEIIPQARRDPSYLTRQDMEIVASGADNAPALPATPDNLSKVVAGRLYVRQRPGPRNSLGLAKFIFPNDEDVYMHGTPSQDLFSRARRDFSHGCVRVEDPTRFAEWILRDQPGWNRERIKAAMQGDKPVRVNLKQPLTVVLFYDTVHVNSQGMLFFVEDIYGHDRALDAALGQGYPYPVKS
jgi:L,D-transpeptidase YcbB